MKRALITGASGGIGSGIARRLSADGYDVILHYNKTDISALAEELGGLAVKADLQNESEVASMFEAAGKIDVLVNCAGVAAQMLFTDISADEWDRVFDINVKGTFLCCKEAAKQMIFRKSGKIINISSMWGITGASCEVHYSSSKAAVIGLTKALAKELAPSGITVNCVAPGFIDTPMNAHLSAESVEAFRQEIPLERLGTAEDVAGAVSFLASKDADYITGQILSVDGGVTV